MYAYIFDPFDLFTHVCLVSGGCVRVGGGGGEGGGGGGCSDSL